MLLIVGVWAALFDFPNAWNRVAAMVNESTPLDLARWSARPFRLGLDLLGGSELVYEANLSQITEKDRNEAMEGVRDVIERRVNALGVAEPVVQVVRTSGAYRVVVQLAGIRDINEAIREIGETPVLEFKERGVPDPEAQKTYEAAFAEAEGRMNDMTARLAARPRLSFDTLAREFGVTVESLGFITATREPALWEWANEHGVGARTTTEPIETSDGWSFIEVLNAREGSNEVEVSHILICFEGATRCTRDTSKEDARKQIEDLK